MKTNRPNILFILSDDHGPWAMGCAGNPEIETPNLDRLAASGRRFTNFFCASPVCSPARATLLTGRIPSQHGVHDWIAAGDTVAKYEPLRNGELIEYLAGMPAYSDLLAGAGYKCGISGKWHLGDAHHPQKSFEFWKVHAKGGGNYYNAPMISNGELREEPRYVTDVITDNALEWLENEKNSPRPFYLGVHYTAPHSPWSRDNHPPEIYDRYFNHCPFNSVPDGETAPEWVKYLNIPMETPEKRRAALSGYYAAVTAMDFNIGRLLDWLADNGRLDNTLVIFTSDNGMSMGHHGVYGKGNATYPLNMFEEAVKVPFIAAQPGQIAPGQVNTELVSQYDFLPTLLDYTGIENPLAAQLPGVSFADCLRGTGSGGHEHLVVYDEYGPVRMVRTRDWKYVHRYKQGPCELYDLNNDPGERRNLAGKAECQMIEVQMRQRLTDWFARYAVAERDGAGKPVTGSGQLGLCEADGIDRPAFSQYRVKNISNRS